MSLPPRVVGVLRRLRIEAYRMLYTTGLFDVVPARYFMVGLPIRKTKPYRGEKVLSTVRRSMCAKSMLYCGATVNILFLFFLAWGLVSGNGSYTRDFQFDKSTLNHQLSSKWKVVSDAEVRRIAADSGEEYSTGSRTGDVQPLNATLIASCKDRSQILSPSLRSWRRVRGLSQIILLDYGSENEEFMNNLEEGLSQNPSIAEVHVAMTDTSAPWVLSRAYNLAASLASGRTLVKVDCDTILLPGFLEKHPIRSGDNRRFYTSNWRRLRNNPLAGVLVVSLAAFLRSGGYDERITTYGGESVELYERMIAEHKMYSVPLLRSSCHHISDDVTLSSVSETEDNLYSPTSARENVLAVSSLPNSWSRVTKRKIGSTFRLFMPVDRPRGLNGSSTVCARAVPSRLSTDAMSMLSDEDLNRVQTGAVQQVLLREHSIPVALTREMSEYEASSFLTAIYSGGKRAVFAEVDDETTADKLHNVALAVAVAAYMRRPAVIFWSKPAKCENTSSRSLLQMPWKRPEIREEPLFHQLVDVEATKENLAEQNVNTDIFVGRHWPCKGSLRIESRLPNDIKNVNVSMLGIIGILSPQIRHNHLHMKQGAPHASKTEEQLFQNPKIQDLYKKAVQSLAISTAVSRSFPTSKNATTLTGVYLAGPQKRDTRTSLSTTTFTTESRPDTTDDSSVVEQPRTNGCSGNTFHVAATPSHRHAANKVRHELGVLSETTACSKEGAEEDRHCTQADIGDILTLLRACSVWPLDDPRELQSHAYPGASAILAMRSALRA